MGWKSVDFW